MQLFCLTLLAIMIFNILSAFALTQYKVELLMISDISQAETVRQDVARYLVEKNIHVYVENITVQAI